MSHVFRNNPMGVKPHSSPFRFRYDEFDITYRFNNMGFRDDRDYAPPKPGGPLRIAMVGDSMVEGFGVQLSDTLPKLLESRLRTKYNVEVLNCSWGGSGPVKWHAVLRYILDAGLAPDLVLYNVFTFNNIAMLARPVFDAYFNGGGGMADGQKGVRKLLGRTEAVKKAYRLAWRLRRDLGFLFSQRRRYMRLAREKGYRVDFSNAPFPSSDHSYFRLPEAKLQRLYQCPDALLTRYFGWKLHPFLVNTCMVNSDLYRDGYMAADDVAAARAEERFAKLLARTEALVPGRMVLFSIPGCAEFFDHPLLLDLGLDLDGLDSGRRVYRAVDKAVAGVPGLEACHLAEGLRKEVASSGMDWSDLFFRWDFHFKPVGNAILADEMSGFLQEKGVLDRIGKDSL